jgi:hypothetical protein
MTTGLGVEIETDVPRQYRMQPDRVIGARREAWHE